MVSLICYFVIYAGSKLHE